jgi:hypothetical protein
MFKSRDRLRSVFRGAMLVPARHAVNEQMAPRPSIGPAENQKLQRFGFYKSMSLVFAYGPVTQGARPSVSSI